MAKQKQQSVERQEQGRVGWSNRSGRGEGGAFPIRRFGWMAAVKQLDGWQRLRRLRIGIAPSPNGASTSWRPQVGSSDCCPARLLMCWRSPMTATAHGALWRDAHGGPCGGGAWMAATGTSTEAGGEYRRPPAGGAQVRTTRNTVDAVCGCMKRRPLLRPSAGANGPAWVIHLASALEAEGAAPGWTRFLMWAGHRCRAGRW